MPRQAAATRSRGRRGPGEVRSGGAEPWERDDLCREIRPTPRVKRSGGLIKPTSGRWSRCRKRDVLPAEHHCRSQSCGSLVIGTRAVEVPPAATLVETGPRTAGALLRQSRGSRRSAESALRPLFPATWQSGEWADRRCPCSRTATFRGPKRLLALQPVSQNSGPSRRGP